MQPLASKAYGASQNGNATPAERIAAYERCFDLFDGNDPPAVEAARARWRTRKAEGHAVTYWQQTERGGWERKG